jgi:hypothetical protein
MGYDKKQLKEPTKPLYGFGSKRIKPVGVITLPISFGTPKKNPHIIHNLRCCRHAISLQCHLWAGPIEHFQSLLHSTYLCLKVPATFGVVTVFDSQKEAKNIEHGFALCHKNVRFLREDTNQPKQPSPRQEISVEFKKAIKADGDFTRLALDPRVPDSTVCIGAEISPQ